MDLGQVLFHEGCRIAPIVIALAPSGDVFLLVLFLAPIWRRLDWLKVLTSGPQPRNPVEVLGSPKMGALIEQLKQQYEVILFDTPALVAATDAAVLAPAMDGVLLVVGRAQARREAVRAACKQLADVKAAFIGVVENWAEADHADGYYRRASEQPDERPRASQSQRRRA